jgi:ATP-dependent helicase YprA (DUF1998 family)
MFLFPTKALAQDQYVGLQALIEAAVLISRPIHMMETLRLQNAG